MSALAGSIRDRGAVAQGLHSTVVTRLCIDQLRSARVKREEYVGPWMSEPLLTEPASDFVEVTALEESLSMASLVLLESLIPAERAVFLLREVFDYGSRTYPR